MLTFLWPDTENAKHELGFYSVATREELTSKTSSGMAAFHFDVDLMCS